MSDQPMKGATLRLSLYLLVAFALGIVVGSAQQWSFSAPADTSAAQMVPPQYRLTVSKNNPQPGETVTFTAEMPQATENGHEIREVLLNVYNSDPKGYGNPVRLPMDPSQRGYENCPCRWTITYQYPTEGTYTPTAFFSRSNTSGTANVIVGSAGTTITVDKKDTVVDQNVIWKGTTVLPCLSFTNEVCRSSSSLPWFLTSQPYTLERELAGTKTLFDTCEVADKDGANYLFCRKTEPDPKNSLVAIFRAVNPQSQYNNTVSLLKGGLGDRRSSELLLGGEWLIRALDALAATLRSDGKVELKLTFAKPVASPTTYTIMRSGEKNGTSKFDSGYCNSGVGQDSLLLCRLTVNALPNSNSITEVDGGALQSGRTYYYRAYQSSESNDGIVEGTGTKEVSITMPGTAPASVAFRPTSLNTKRVIPPTGNNGVEIRCIYKQNTMPWKTADDISKNVNVTVNDISGAESPRNCAYVSHTSRYITYACHFADSNTYYAQPRRFTCSNVNIPGNSVAAVIAACTRMKNGSSCPGR